MPRNPYNYQRPLKGRHLQHSLAEEGAILERLPEVGGVTGGVDVLSSYLSDPLQGFRRQVRAVLAQNLPEKTSFR